MTEDEAKTKWCPFFRSAIAFRFDRDEHLATNRSGLRDENGSKCLGSACMAWRWKSEQVEERDMYRRGTGRFRTEDSNTDGHCGLAGP